MPLPSISIVVPNYNGAATLGRALESLVSQGYPDLQILVMDGGSTDGSVDVIRRFEDHIDGWVSEKDRGQSHALNRGLARARGEVVNWLCSDDVLLPGALEAVGRAFAEEPAPDVVVGRCRVEFDGEPLFEKVFKPSDVDLLPCLNRIPQSSCFFRRSLLRREPPIDESYEYAMDFELWNYLKSQGARWRAVDEVLSVFHQSAHIKTNTGGLRIAREQDRIYRRYSGERVPLTLWHRWLRHPVERVWARYPGRAARYALLPYWKVVSGALSLFYGRQRVQSINWQRWARGSIGPSPGGGPRRP